MKNYVWSIFLLLSVVVLFLGSEPASASTSLSPKLFLNGVQVETDVNPIIENDSTLVPLAVLSKSLGYAVKWDGETQKVTVNNDNTFIELYIGNVTATVNGQSAAMLTAPILHESRTMVPVRFVGELLGLEFEWKQQEYEVHMTTKPVPKPEVEISNEPSATIKNIFLDSENVLHIEHEGLKWPAQVKVYENPRRYVIDFAGTTYDPELLSAFTNGQFEWIAEENTILSKFRYSQFKTEPLIARLVIEIGDKTTYSISETENELLVLLTDQEVIQPEPEVIAPDPVPVKDYYTVVIDAGHGGKDTGAISILPNYFEKQFNLSFALKLKAELEKNSKIKVEMTRSDDTFLELVERIAFAEEKAADLYISIHANSFTKSTIEGVETYYYKDNSEELAKAIHPAMLSGTGLKDRGVKQAAFKVIKETTMPAILLEAGYLSNANDASVISKESVQSKLAVQVAEAVVKYLKLK